MIQRIFHPIGQGAFYSERHDNFNIVYDCGNWRNTKLADKVVRQAFLKNDTVDILFISHFDYDHVNKIKTLSEHTQIKKVIMPLLHDNEKTLLINLYRALNFRILNLIEDPQEFFGPETQIITVNPSENIERPINDNIEPIDLDNLTTRNIQSGAILRKNFGSYEWLFIPYNYQYSSRNRELKILLKQNGFDVVKLETDSKHTINEIISNRKKIKSIYEKVSGNINQNSMLLYSGPLQTPCRVKHWHHSQHCTHIKGCMEFRHRGAGCLYTGDSNLNIIKAKLIFGNVWKNVGTVQIPHHGDLKSFNQEILDDRYYLCPISVGEKNSYGHPSSKVIAGIFSERSLPVLVTENLSSGLVECIKC